MYVYIYILDCTPQCFSFLMSLPTKACSRESSPGTNSVGFSWEVGGFRTNSSLSQQRRGPHLLQSWWYHSWWRKGSKEAFVFLVLLVNFILETHSKPHSELPFLKKDAVLLWKVLLYCFQIHKFTAARGAGQTYDCGCCLWRGGCSTICPCSAEQFVWYLAPGRV